MRPEVAAEGPKQLLRGRYLTAAVSIVIERYEVEGTLLSIEYRSESYEGSRESS